MKFIIKHEIRGRIRIHLIQDRMSYKEADILQYYLERLEEVTHAKVYEKTADAAIRFTGDRTAVIRALKAFHYSEVDVPAAVIEHSGRELNAVYKEKLINKVVLRLTRRWIVPYPVRAVYILCRALRYA